MKTALRLALSLAFLSATLSASAVAASPWDGTWKLDESKSHLTGDSFTYTRTATGMWHVAFGKLGFDFATDGKPYPVFDPEHTQTATMNGDHAITFVNQFKGKTTSTMKETLSADGQTITDETSGVHVDGSSYTSSEVSKRSGPGKDFFAKWISTKTSSSAQGTITVSTAADGTMTWTYPMSKETLMVKPGGPAGEVKGPQATPGVTVAYKTSSPRRQTFLVELKGKTIAEGYDELAADGKSFTETSWAPGLQSEKTSAFYARQ